MCAGWRVCFSRLKDGWGRLEKELKLTPKGPEEFCQWWPPNRPPKESCFFFAAAYTPPSDQRDDAINLTLIYANIGEDLGCHQIFEDWGGPQKGLQWTPPPANVFLPIPTLPVFKFHVGRIQGHKRATSRHQWPTTSMFNL